MIWGCNEECESPVRWYTPTVARFRPQLQATFKQSETINKDSTQNINDQLTQYADLQNARKRYQKQETVTQAQTKTDADVSPWF